jgi:tetratricopeptide (TPR) repeat protein/transcriptional regulator with XRE-family HTH domain
MSHDSIFATVLKRYVRVALYSTQQLASLTGISRDTIANWLDGVVKKPRAWSDLLKIATALHLSEPAADDLLAAAGHPSVVDLRPRLRELLDTPVSQRDRELLMPWIDASAARRRHVAEVESATLAQALDRLAALPLDTVPAYAPLPPRSRLPLAPNPHVVGRLDALRRIAALLRDGPVALNGLGGIGKTQLASEFAHRYGQFFPGGVFWISFADPNAVADQVALLGGPEYLALRPDWPSMSRDDQVGMVRAAWSSALPRLLIFDNCEDTSLLQAWLPATGGCRVLITGRRAEWDAALGVRVIALGTLDRESSVALLRSYGLQDARGDVLAAIADELGDLPLALHLAGSYLRQARDQIAPDAYLRALRRPDLLAHPSLQGGPHSPTGHLQHVGRTFALSWDRLDPADPTHALALRLLARAAWFAPGEPIPRDLLLLSASIAPDGPVTARLQAADAIARLESLGLTQPARAGMIRIHRLVVAFTRARLTDAAAQAAVERALLGAGDRLCDIGDIAAMQQFQPHLRAAIDAASHRRDAPAADLVLLLGNYERLSADYARAQRSLERSLAMRGDGEDVDPLAIAATQNLLGLVCQMRCEFSRARELFESAIAIWDREVGPDDPRASAEHNNLGYLLQLTGDYAGAAAHLRAALLHRRKHYGLRDFGTARRIHNMGFLLLRQGHYVRARRYLMLALRIRERILAPDHLATALTLHLLGEVHFWLGDAEAALACHTRELAMREKLRGERHHDVAESLLNLGRVLHAQGDLDRARALLDRALEINGATLGMDHRETIYVRLALGALLRDQGAHESAHATITAAIAAWERLFDAEHPELVAPLNQLARTLIDLHRDDEAGAAVSRALAICRARLDDQHPHYAWTLYQRGWLCRRAGDRDGAMASFSAALAASSRLPAAHPLRAAIDRALAALQPDDDASCSAPRTTLVVAALGVWA